MLPLTILQDNTSGSSAITRMVGNWMRTELLPAGHIDLNEIRKDFEILHRTFPHFAALKHFTSEFLGFLDRHYANWDPESNVPAFQQFVDDYQSTWVDNQKLAAENLISSIDFRQRTILLHSNSGSLIILLDVLLLIGVKPKIIQTVSEPGKEGILQARRLAELGFEVTLINEAAAGRFMNEIDMFITGADAIYSDFLINKTGTMPLALTCKFFGKPYYMLADSRKLIAGNLGDINQLADVFEKPKPAREILSDAPAGIRPVNYYFELVSNDLVSAIFTELRS